MAFAWPLSPLVSVRGSLQPRTISSYFGPRANPVTGEGQNHGAIDLPVDVGTTVRSIGRGLVEKVVQDHPEAGTYVEINHGNGYWSRYLHLSGVTTPVGTQVSLGTPIGLTGGLPGAYGSGRSTGPHLHLEIWNGPPYRGGTPVDPLPLLTQEAFSLVRDYWWVLLLGGTVVAGALVWRYKPEWLK